MHHDSSGGPSSDVSKRQNFLSSDSNISAKLNENSKGLKRGDILKKVLYLCTSYKAIVKMCSGYWRKFCGRVGQLIPLLRGYDFRLVVDTADLVVCAETIMA